MRYHLAAAGALVVLATACGSDSAVAPRANTLDSALGELSLTSGLPSASGMPAGKPPGITPGTCAFDAGSQSFTCPVVSGSGYTVTRSYTLLNASGTPQSAFDPATTAAIRSTSSATGSTTLGGVTTTFDATETRTLSGLLAGAHVLNGTGLSHATTTGTYASRSTTATTITDVVPPDALGPGNYPKSGSVAMAITDERSFGPPVTTRITMTFNGTSKVSIVITDAFITQRCTFDLAATGGGLVCG